MPQTTAADLLNKPSQATATNLLNELRQEQGTAEDLLNSLREQDVETTPFELPEASKEPRVFSPIPVVQERMERETPRPDPFSESDRRAAESGVDVTTGAPTGRARAGFAGNEALKAEFLRKELSQFYGQDVRIRKGPDSGELEFFNPETRRFTLVDEATRTSRDLADFLGDSLVFLGAGVGEVFGGIPGAAAGGAAGEAARQGVGKLLGINEEISGADVVNEGLLTGGGSAVFRAGGAVTRAVRDFRKPPGVKADVAETALNSLESNQAIADEISRRSGQRFQPLTGLLSGDETLLGAQAALRTSPETAVALRERTNQNETALEAFFDEATPQGAVPSEVGRRAQSTARSSTQARRQDADRVVRNTIDELENLTQTLPRAGDDTTGRGIRELVIEERRKLKGLETEAYERAQELYGLNPDTGLSDIKIPIRTSNAADALSGNDVTKTFNALSNEAKEALFAEQAAGKAILTPDTITNAKDLDLHQMEEAIRFLRRRQRIDARNAVAASPQGRDVNRALNALVRRRSEFLSESHPEILEAIESAEFVSAQRARLFDKSILRSILVKDDTGEFVLRDREVIARTIASGDKEATQHLMSILGENPAGQAELQKAMLAFYRNEVVEDGIPVLALHKRFIERHGDALKVIFPKSKGVTKFGEVTRAANVTIARAENFKKVIAKTFKGRIQNIAPENVIKDMFGRRFSVKDANRFRNLAQAGGFYGPYQRAVGDEIRRRIFTNNILSPTKLDSLLSQNGEVIKGLLGARYVADLQVLLKGLRLAGRQPSGIATRTSNTLLDAMRVLVAPPLTQRGRAQTLVQNVNRRAIERAMLNAISEPKALRAVVAQRNKDIRSKEVLGLLGALGGAAIGAEE